MTKVIWRIHGQQTERATFVPDGEVYVDWIAQKWDLDSSKIEILSTEGA